MEASHAIAGLFLKGERAVILKPYGNGHVNTTYVVETDLKNKYILQRVNTGIFRDPAALMENIIGVTEYLRGVVAARGGDELRETLGFLPLASSDGKKYFTVCGDGDCWRMMRFIGNAVSPEDEPTADVLYNVGALFGGFMNDLAGYPAEKLHETIPHFHDTPKRYEAFLAAVKKNAAGRVAGCADEIEFVRSRRELCETVTGALRDGRIPVRVTHNDTKINNALIDAVTGRGLCVLDLDTVMPGSALYDFGDALRSCATSAPEDEPDISKVCLRTDFFGAFASGYLSRAASSLTETEKALLPQAARLMTYECGMRFLTDYLDGDLYFRVSRPSQNLDRARAHFRLVTENENKMAEINNIIGKALAASPIKS